MVCEWRGEGLSVSGRDGRFVSGDVMVCEW